MSGWLKVAGIVVNAILVVAYPLAIFWGLTHFSGRSVSLFVLALVVPALAWRFRKTERATLASMIRLPVAILALLTLGAVLDDARFVLAMPVLVNAVLLLEFAGTLRAGATPMIERFARMQEPELSEEKQRHCRAWTVAWCVFFVANGATAAALALCAPIWWWTVYTGGVAYALMGVLFAVERVQRRVRFGT